MAGLHMQVDKRAVLDAALPAKSVLDFGGGKQASYAQYCQNLGCPEVTIIDCDPSQIDRSQFDVPAMSRNFEEDDLTGLHADLGLMFDVLLYQLGPLRTLRRCLACVDRVCVAQPVLVPGIAPPMHAIFLQTVKDQETQDRLRPTLEGRPSQLIFYFPQSYNYMCWLWGLGADLISAWIEREGFVIREQQTNPLCFGEAWEWWACYAERMPA